MRLPDMALIQLEINLEQVVAVKCSVSQIVDSDVKNEERGVETFLNVWAETGYKINDG